MVEQSPRHLRITLTSGDGQVLDDLAIRNGTTLTHTVREVLQIGVDLLQRLDRGEELLVEEHGRVLGIPGTDHVKKVSTVKGPIPLASIFISRPR